METQLEFDVVLESKYAGEVKKAEKRAGADALALVKRVLANAGMDEDYWLLRDPKRITKKGPQKFKVIRVDSRGGYKSIRFWCKPKGNDTSYEYSLVPPNGVDIEKLFKILQRTDSISLGIPESIELPVAFFNRILDIKPTSLKPIPPVKQTPIEKKPQELSVPTFEKQSEHLVFVTESSEQEEPSKQEEPSEDSQEKNYSSKEASTHFVPKIINNEIEKISSLLILDPMMLSDHEAMDKALLAMAMVCVDGYAKRIALSSVIIENLGINEFVKSICQGRYSTTESAMKSLMTALVNNNYIERIRSESGESGYKLKNGAKGYKLTPKGEKRIKVLMDRSEENIVSKISSNWFESIQSKSEIEESEEVSEISEEISQTLSITSESIEKLKNLIEKHEKASAEISETENLLENLNSEKKELLINQTGFDLAEEQKKKQIEELQKELNLIVTKKIKTKQEMEQKNSEIENWEKYKLPFVEELARVEEEIFRLTGRRKT
jgi:hypothetical protein